MHSAARCNLDCNILKTMGRDDNAYIHVIILFLPLQLYLLLLAVNSPHCRSVKPQRSVPCSHSANPKSALFQTTKRFLYRKLQRTSDSPLSMISLATT